MVVIHFIETVKYHVINMSYIEERKTQLTTYNQRKRDDMMTTENDILFNVRDSPATASAIEDLILGGEFSSKSEFIRTAIRELLNQFSTTSNSKKVIVNLAAKRYNRANYFIGKGYALNFETLFNDLLIDYINEMEELQRKEMEMNQKIMMKKIELSQLEEISNSKFG